LYVSQGRRKSKKGNKVKKEVKATATTEREIHYKSVARITGSSISCRNLGGHKTTAFAQQS
jgi:hypothetical protein